MDGMPNVFQIWMENNKVLPFKVRRWSWHPSTFFLVKRIEIKPDSVYGKAYGDMYLHGKLAEENILLNCAGCYQWILIR